MSEVQMLCCFMLYKNNEFLMYLVNSSEAKLITLWWLPLLTLLWTTQNYLWYPLCCNACCTTIPWNQDLENKPEISPDPPNIYIYSLMRKKLDMFSSTCICLIYNYYKFFSSFLLRVLWAPFPKLTELGFQFSRKKYVCNFFRIRLYMYKYSTYS